MPVYQDPAASRRRLQRDLRRLRREAGTTQRDVAVAMDWSPSKLIRIESGAVAVSTNDLRALLGHYRVTDAEVVDDLIATAKNAKKSSWGEYRDVVGQAAVTYFGYEASAVIIRQYEPLLIPGLLQTEEYMRAVFKRVLFPKNVANLDRLVQARLERQELLDRDELPELFFVLDEAVVRRQMGGPATMRRQLDRLQDLASQEKISIQIVPFDRGGYEGLSGPFTLLDLPDDDTVLYLESRSEKVTRDDPDEIGDYLDLFQQLEREATPAAELTDFTTTVKSTSGMGAA